MNIQNPSRDGADVETAGTAPASIAVYCCCMRDPESLVECLCTRYVEWESLCRGLECGVWAVCVCVNVEGLEGFGA